MHALNKHAYFDLHYFPLSPIAGENTLAYPQQWLSNSMRYNPTRAAGMRRGDRTVSFSLHWQLSCQVWQLCVKKRIGVSKRKWKIWHRVHTLLVRDEHTLQKTLKTFPDSPFYRVESSIPVKRNGRTIKNCPMLLYLSVAEILKINSLPPCPYTVDPESFSQMRFRLIKLSRNE